MNLKFEVDLDQYAEGAILLDGFEDCIVGVVEEYGNGKRILYSKNAIIQKLMVRDLMTHGEAEEFYDYNIIGLYAGEQNAVFLDLALEPVLKDGKYTYICS